MARSAAKNVRTEGDKNIVFSVSTVQCAPPSCAAQFWCWCCKLLLQSSRSSCSFCSPLATRPPRQRHSEGVYCRLEHKPAASRAARAGTRSPRRSAYGSPPPPAPVSAPRRRHLPWGVDARHDCQIITPGIHSNERSGRDTCHSAHRRPGAAAARAASAPTHSAPAARSPHPARFAPGQQYAHCVCVAGRVSNTLSTHVLQA